MRSHSHEPVRPGADHVGRHELVELAGDDAAVVLDRILADDGGRRRVDDGREEPAGRLLQRDLEGEVVDDPRVLDDVGEPCRLALGQIHLHDPVPGVLHVLGREVGAVVEGDALPDRERVGEPVGRHEPVGLGRHLGRDHRDRFGAVGGDVDEEVVDLDDGPVGPPTVGRRRRVERLGLTPLDVDEDALGVAAGFPVTTIVAAARGDQNGHRRRERHRPTVPRSRHASPLPDPGSRPTPRVGSYVRSHGPATIVLRSGSKCWSALTPATRQG